MNWDVLRYRDDKGHLGLNGLDDGRSGVLSRDEDGGNMRLYRPHGLGGGQGVNCQSMLSSSRQKKRLLVYLSDCIKDR